MPDEYIYFLHSSYNLIDFFLFMPHLSHMQYLVSISRSHIILYYEKSSTAYIEISMNSDNKRKRRRFELVDKKKQVEQKDAAEERI